MMLKNVQFYLWSMKCRTYNRINIYRLRFRRMYRELQAYLIILYHAFVLSLEELGLLELE